MKRESWFLISVFVFVGACTAAKMVQDPPAVPTTSTSSNTSTQTSTSCKSGTWCYDSIVSPMITSAMMGADVTDVCKYPPTDRRMLWVHIVTSISLAESSWNPNNVYQEDFIDSTTGKLALSVGLLQLSTNDITKKTPYCLKVTPATLVDPTINLGCGVEIMNWLVTRAGNTNSVLDLGAYWSTMRPSVYNKKLDATVHNANFDNVVKELKALEPGC